MSQIQIPKGFETIDPKKLKPHPNNVKIHTKEQVKGIAEAIKLLGIFKDPIVIDKKNLVWIGNGRLEAALMLEMPLVPIIYLDHLSQKHRKALMILDNRLNESKWNKENMISVLAEIQDFDFQIFNVDFKEFQPKEIIQDSIPEKRKTTDVKQGDIFQLGNHRLMCGDSREDISEFIKNCNPKYTITDPPYNIGFKYNSHKDKQNKSDYAEFMKKIFDNIPSANIILTPGPKNLGIWYGIKEPDDIGTWVKRNSRSGASAFHFRRCEPILFYGKFKKRNDDLFDFSMENYKELDAIQTEVGVAENHAPAKPLKFWACLITDFTEEKEIVFDPFMGTGTTIIACEQTNRICYGIEIDRFYIQVIIDRWEKLTGRKAKKVN